jgi:hypothetical protein
LNIRQHADFLVAVSIVIVVIVLSFATYSRTMRLSFFEGPFRFSHWLTIIGSTYIAIATPVFAVLKRSPHPNWSKLYSFHIFGNLIFFGLISIHFASQMGRPAANFPELGTGVALFAVMSLQVALGFTQRFRSQNPWYKKIFNIRGNRFFHASLIAVFYFVIIFHVLHGLGFT